MEIWTLLTTFSCVLVKFARWRVYVKKMWYRPCNTWTCCSIIKASMWFASPKTFLSHTQKPWRSEKLESTLNVCTGSLKIGLNEGNGELNGLELLYSRANLRRTIRMHHGFLIRQYIHIRKKAINPSTLQHWQSWTFWHFWDSGPQKGYHPDTCFVV